MLHAFDKPLTFYALVKSLIFYTLIKNNANVGARWAGLSDEYVNAHDGRPKLQSTSYLAHIALPNDQPNDQNQCPKPMPKTNDQNQCPKP